MKYKGISLFSGIAGFELGLILAGLSPYIRLEQFVEKDAFCQKILAQHFPSVPICSRIQQYDPFDCRRAIVWGGFPCQDISSAGKGAGIKPGTRSGLFFELMRVVAKVRPRIVFLENVPALLSNSGGMDIVLASLAACGYDAEWSVISAADVGAVHLRERVWIIAYPQNASTERVLGNKKANKPCQNYLMSHQDLPSWLPHATDTAKNRFRKPQLQALGNAVVPQAAAVGWRRIGVILGVLEEGCWRSPVFAKSFAWFDGATQSFKTWQRHLFEGWQLYTESFPRQGAMRNGELYYQQLWLAAKKTYNALPTPTANDNDNCRIKPTPAELEGSHGWALRSAIAGIEQGVYPNLPTPTASDGTVGAVLNESTRIYRTKNGTPRKISNQGIDGSVGLARFVQLEARATLPTPTARDWENGSAAQVDKPRSESLSDRAACISGNPKLNPKFVAAMMGFPLDWLDLT